MAVVPLGGGCDGGDVVDGGEGGGRGDVVVIGGRGGGAGGVVSSVALGDGVGNCFGGGFQDSCIESSDFTP
jgi:hypothetical protein